MDTQDQLQRLRQLDVDVDALLEAAVSLAETRRDVRAKATEAPLPPEDPRNLSRVLVVPAVEVEDVDPVELLEAAVGMVRVDQRPALALQIASETPIGSGGPLANVQGNPSRLFAPEVARHVLRLLDIARRPHAGRWLEGSDGPAPLFDDRFLPLTRALSSDADEVAQLFNRSFRDPLLVHDEIILMRRSELDAQAPPATPEDVPIGQATPPTEAELEARRAEWEVQRTAVLEETALVLRHAAQRAADKLLSAAGQNPSHALHPIALAGVAEALANLPEGRRVHLLAELLHVDPKTVRRALKVYGQKFKVRTRRYGHSSAVRCPRNAAKSTLTIRSPGAERTGRKQGTHDEEHRPQPTETPGTAALLQEERLARPDRDQRLRLGKSHRVRPGEGPPHRKDRPRQPG